MALNRFLSEQIGTEIFFIIVGEHCYYYRVISKLILNFERPDEVCPGRNTHSQTQLCQLLSHQDSVTVIYRYYFVKLAEIYYRRYEFIRHALYSVMPDFVPCA